MEKKKFLEKQIERYALIPIQVKASIWFTICSVLQKGISIITVPLFTRIMTREQYGYYTTYISWYNVLLVFTSLNLFYGVFNNAMLKYKDDRASYISSMQGLVFTITAAFFVFYLVIQEKANVMLEMSTPLVLMLFLELLLTPSLQFWFAANRFEFKYKNIVAVTIIKSIANPLLGLVLVLISEQKEVARIASIVITEGIVCSIITVIQFSRGKRFFSKEYWKYALLFNLPLLPHYLSGQILNQSDRIMISRMVGNSAVAIYGVAYNIGLLMNIFTNAIIGAYTPWFYQSVEKKDYDSINKVMRVIVCLMMLLVIALMFVGPEAIAILGSEEYREGMYAILPVAAAAFFFFLYNIYANLELYYEKKYYVLFSSVFAAALNLVLNYVFIRKYGYIAAAYTTLASYCIYCALHSMFAMRICKQKGIPQSIFSQKIVLLASTLVIAITLIMNIVYSYVYVRISIIVVTIVLVFLYRKKIVPLLIGTFGTIRKK